MGLLGEFTATLERPYDRALRWREEHGSKLVACAPMHLPEELVHASGMMPLVLQESSEPITIGHAYVYPFFCGLVRSIVDVGLKGHLNFLDGIIFPDTCLQMRAAASALKWQDSSFPGKDSLPYLEFVQLPVALRKPAALGETIAALERLRGRLEEFAGQPISDDSIRASIAIYNRNRALMRRLDELRRQRPGLLSAKDMLAVVVSSMVWPKEEHSQLLEQLLADLEEREPSIRLGEPSLDHRVRLFLSGHLCQAPKVGLLELIEESGGVVVADDLYTGYRYYASDVDGDGGPIEGLTRRYLKNMPPCPTRSDPSNDWAQYLIEAARGARAQGVIILMVKFCEPHAFYYPHIKRALSAAGIPCLLLETEHDMVSLEGVKTRLQAFYEMVSAVKTR